MLHKNMIAPVLDEFELDSETWHERARDLVHSMETSRIRLAMLQLLALGSWRYAHPKLETTLGSLTLENPVLVGAGWDKKGMAVRGLHALGFAGVEVGSVLEHPQPGNPKPRQFMIGEGVSLNRLGFNSPGMEAVAENLKRYEHDGIPIGISLGKNKEVPPEDAPEAHAAVVRHMAPYASYFAVNVSSPNTPGLRALQEKKPLTDIVQAVKAALRAMGLDTDVYIKIAPDLTLTAVDDVMQVARDEDATGIIAANTSNNENLKAKHGERWRHEAGGLSGNDAEFRAMSTRQIAHIHRETKGAFEIIGVGGVKDGKTAMEKIKAGAKAVQVVTAIRGEGAGVAKMINRGIVSELHREGLKSVRDAVGVEYPTRS